MTNEQEHVPSRGFNIFAKICGIIFVGIIVGIPILEYTMTGTLHPRGIGMVIIFSVVTALIVTFMVVGANEVLWKRYPWTVKYMAIFFSVTMISALPVKNHFEPDIPATFVTLKYAATIGMMCSVLTATTIVLFRRIRPSRTSQ